MNDNMDKTHPKLYCLYFDECDKKKCTAFKLKNLDILNFISNIQGPLEKAVLLHPFSKQVISNNDSNIILKFGLIVLDCSWKIIRRYYLYFKRN